MQYIQVNAKHVQVSLHNGINQTNHSTNTERPQLVNPHLAQFRLGCSTWHYPLSASALQFLSKSAKAACPQQDFRQSHPVRSSSANLRHQDYHCTSWCTMSCWKCRMRFWPHSSMAPACFVSPSEKQGAEAVVNITTSTTVEHLSKNKTWTTVSEWVSE